MLSIIQVPAPPSPPPPPPPPAAVPLFFVTLDFKVRIVVPHQWGVDETTASGVARLNNTTDHYGVDIFQSVGWK